MRNNKQQTNNLNKLSLAERYIKKLDTMIEKEYKYLIQRHHEHIARELLHIGCIMHLSAVLYHISGICRELILGVKEIKRRIKL